jgi:acyl carrier protein phosphodiesterase
VSDKEFDNQFTSVKNSISTESKLTKDLVNTRANEIKTLIKNELTDSRDEMQEVKSLILDTLDNQAESILESLVNQSSLSQTVQQRIQLHYQEVLPQQMSNFSAQITKLRADFTQEFEDTNSFMARTSWLVYSLFIIVVIVLLVGITVTCRRIRRLRNENKHIVHYNSVEFGKPNNLGNKKSSSMEETIMNY